MGAALIEFLRRQNWLRSLRLARLAYVTARGQPKWRRRLAAAAPSGPPALSPRVLIGTSVGMHLAATTLDSLLAAALALRGANVEILLCDGVLPACMACQASWFPDFARFAQTGPREFCATCFDHAARMFGELGVTVRRYSDLLTEDDRALARRLATDTEDAELGAVMLGPVAVGQHALSGALRFLARGDLAEAQAKLVLRRFLEAAILTTLAARRLFAEHAYAATVLHHGIYVPQGPIADAARAAGVRIVTWNPAYRKRCFIFSHGDTYHRTLMDEPSEAWAEMPWTAAEDARIRSYLASRAEGSEDWISFNPNSRGDAGAIAREFGLDPARPIIVLLTNVIWDAQLHYPANAFPTMMDWLLGTIAHFAARPEMQLVIRVHPAERTGAVRSRQTVAAEIARVYPTLPANVTIIPPESRASSYAIAQLSDTALIYGTKMGVELAAQCIPVIVAGEAWVRAKGLTADATSAEDYYALLGRLPRGRRLDEAISGRARKYAFHFFFRRMIPLDAVAPRAGWPPYRIVSDGFDALRPGVSPGLDVICDGILEGTPFIYPAERYAATD